MNSIGDNLTNTTFVSFENERPESYVGKELDVHSIGPLEPDTSISDSGTSNDPHTGLTQKKDNLVISGSRVRAEQEGCRLELADCNYLHLIGRRAGKTKRYY